MVSLSNRYVLSICYRRGALWDAPWDAGERFRGDAAHLSAPSQSAFLNPRAQNTEFSKAPTVDSCFIFTLTPPVILASTHPPSTRDSWMFTYTLDFASKIQALSANCLLSSSKKPRGFQMNKSKNLLPSFNLFLPQSYPGQFNSSSCWGQTIWSQPWSFSFSHSPNPIY